MNQRADVVGENLCALLFCMIVITSCRPFICGVSVCCMLRYISLFTPQSLEQVSAKKMDRKDRQTDMYAGTNTHTDVKRVLGAYRNV
ncbi:hypothetical protein P8452_22636 [Trifolium repens]|nr:hypothetical protein P8452_22636 [Trifolium repens]